MSYAQRGSARATTRATARASTKSSTKSSTSASVLPFLLFATAVAYLVPSALLSDHTPSVSLPREAVVWKAAYSEKYPGCVASVLWPGQEHPVALVVITSGGDTARISGTEAQFRAANRSSADDVRPIGACRAAGD